MGRIRQRADIGYDLCDFLFGEDFAKGWHLRKSAVCHVFKTNTVGHSLGNVVDSPAPKPVIIQQVRIPNGTRSTRSVALCTQRFKNRSAPVHRKAVQVGVLL